MRSNWKPKTIAQHFLERSVVNMENIEVDWVHISCNECIYSCLT